MRIVGVRDEASLDNFVALPWAIHARHPLWVPPLRSQDKALLTPGKHPFWNAARRELFLAMRGNEIAGRIAAIVDDNHNAYARERCGVFGFFECRNDRPAAHALFGAARDWLAGQGCIDWIGVMKEIRTIPEDVLLIHETVWQLQSQDHKVDPVWQLRQIETACWFLENCNTMIPAIRDFKIPGNI